MSNKHSFHIPVMGIGYTVDTPLKVSHYGIDSVISLVDDILLEKLRRMYCDKFELPYDEITDKTEDFRAKRITSYLNLINHLVEKKFEEVKTSASEISFEIKEYFNMLPDASALKHEFRNFADKYLNIQDIRNWIKENLSKGSIDVNIMTKVDKENYFKNEKLPVEYNDAHAALRGFANSDLRSSVVLSAGINPSLYSYIEKFEDFYPDTNGELKKKIILKVSDYRSALIQGKFLAKKGIWVSEYRVESGLNCGGHAFATDGYLLGPILAEFRDKRKELYKLLHEIYVKALSDKNRIIPEKQLPQKISAQGGVGTSEEHQFLLEYYMVDSVGWGTPFLLVPEATTVDESTLQQLIEAKEEDLFLSDISPLGVPFNNLRGNTKDNEKLNLIAKGRPGSSCPKEFVKLYNKEFTERSICTASRQYQFLKLKDLDNKNLASDEYREIFDKVVDKSCICVGLGTSVLLVNNMDTKVEGSGVSICPGPNLAYFSKVMSLKEITDHIYGRTNVITRDDRPHMFMKELGIYIEYLKNKIKETSQSMSDKQEKYLTTFAKNLEDGVQYYHSLIHDVKDKFIETKTGIIKDLEENKRKLNELVMEIQSLSKSADVVQ
jgi:hypothetical protein